jgi:hypothetical protein
MQIEEELLFGGAQRAQWLFLSSSALSQSSSRCAEAEGVEIVCLHVCNL